MDEKFKELRPIDNDGKRMRKVGKCANRTCIGDDVSVRKCKCEACKKADPKGKGRWWCDSCICKYCDGCLPNNEEPCAHCGKNRDGKDTIAKQPFSKLFARFEKKQSTITSDDLEKHLEKFQLNDAMTDASNVEIYQPSIPIWDSQNNKLAILLAVDTDRVGNQADVRTFRDLLPALGYDVDYRPNPSRDDMIKALKAAAASPRDRYEGLLVIIACHGLPGGTLIGSDDEKASLVQLQHIVNGCIAPAFLFKPKIFLVNACRGAPEMRPAFTDDDDYDTMWTNTGADYYIARSNINGYVSKRDRVEGTKFLQTVAEVWKKYFPTESLDDVMALVTQKLGYQALERTSTLTRLVVNGTYV